MTRPGASPEEWAHFDLALGLTADLLPVVSDPDVRVSRGSKLKALGKTPSRVDGMGEAVGIAGWTEREASGAEVAQWSSDPRLGICIQARSVRALDIDVEGKTAELVRGKFLDLLGRRDIPLRYRRDSDKKLLAFRIADGDWRKRSFKVKDGGGLVEFLATGQQFVAAGTHPSGARYEWDGGLPDDFPTIGADAFEEAWSALVEEFGEEGTDYEAGTRKRGEHFLASDEVASWLVEEGLVLGEGHDGQLFVECPWKDGHSGDSGVTEAAWFPAGSGGYERGHYKCLHASCAKRSDEDFREAVGIGTSNDFVDLVAVNEEQGEDGTVSFEAPPFPRDKNGAVDATVNNVMLALEAPGWFGLDVALDTFRDEVMVAKHGTKAWRSLDDADYTLLRRRLERFGFKPVGPEMIRSCVWAVARRFRFDSAQLWLEGLEWDGRPRVETFLAQCFGAEDNAYSRAVSRYWWTGHAARILYPGCRCDMVPILVSPEGRWKSSALTAMLPSIEMFVEIDLEHKDADLSRKMRGALLGELAELRGLSGRSAEANKAWVTRRFEEWTPKYMEKAQRCWRRLMFVGTTNEDEFLDATTGERRWLPVSVGQGDRDLIVASRAQLWAEARVLVEQRMADGTVAPEDAVEWEAAYDLGPAARDDFVREDSWKEPIRRWIAAASESETGEVEFENPDAFPEFGSEHVVSCTIEGVLLGALGISPARSDRRSEMRAGNILRELGFKRVRRMREGARFYAFVGLPHLGRAIALPESER